MACIRLPESCYEIKSANNTVLVSFGNVQTERNDKLGGYSELQGH